MSVNFLTWEKWLDFIKLNIFSCITFSNELDLVYKTLYISLNYVIFFYNLKQTDMDSKELFIERVRKSGIVEFDENTTVEELIVQAETFGKNSQLFEAIISLSLAYQIAPNHDYEHLILKALTSIEDLDLDQRHFFHFNSEHQIETSSWHSKSTHWKDAYEELIEACVRFPNSWASTTCNMTIQIFEDELSKDSMRNDLVRKLQFFSHVENNEDFPWIEFIERIPKSLKKKPEIHADMIDLVVRKVLLQSNGSVWLIAMWVYYNYLGNNFFTEIMARYAAIIDIDLEEEYHKFMSKPTWPWLSEKFAQDKYHKILRLQLKGSERCENIVNELRSLTIYEFVPLIVHSQRNDNAEAISTLLTNTSFPASQFQNYCNRIEELSNGVPLVGVFRNGLQPADRIIWRKNQVERIWKFISKQGQLKQHWKLSTETYVIDPFNPQILSSLFKGSQANEAGTEKMAEMYSYSISKIVSPHSLVQLLINNALYVRNSKALKCTVVRIIELELYDLLISAADEISQRIPRVDYATACFTASIINSYVSTTPKQLLDMARVEKVRMRLSITSSSAKEFISSESKSVRNSRRTAHMVEQGNLKEMFARATSDPEITVREIEQILKSMIKHGTSKQVYGTYEILVRKDRNRATFYNSEVELHILLLNRLKREKSSGGGMTSGIWGIPANLQNPVNRTAANAS
ncbi:MAG: hypothetical protein JWM20_17 [Patescibacteria group bacterium]|nr:hypothetical protein [Patescibacteria group bacterium]